MYNILAVKLWTYIVQLLYRMAYILFIYTMSVLYIIMYNILAVKLRVHYKYVLVSDCFKGFVIHNYIKMSETVVITTSSQIVIIPITSPAHSSLQHSHPPTYPTPAHSSLPHPPTHHYNTPVSKGRPSPEQTSVSLSDLLIPHRSI